MAVHKNYLAIFIFWGSLFFKSSINAFFWSSFKMLSIFFKYLALISADFFVFSTEVFIKTSSSNPPFLVASSIAFLRSLVKNSLISSRIKQVFSFFLSPFLYCYNFINYSTNKNYRNKIIKTKETRLHESPYSLSWKLSI